jgi:signal transduction histidine kinase
VRGPAPRIEGDGWQLQQALLNLVTNALDAMPGGGVLRVQTGAERRDGREWAFVRIADAGPGIPPDHLKRIFEPFFTTKEPGKGSGLGLFITEQVVRDHGGAIEVESAPRHGTSFTLAFPGADGAP